VRIERVAGDEPLAHHLQHVAAVSPKIAGGGIWVDEGLDWFEWCEGAGSSGVKGLVWVDILHLLGFQFGSASRVGPRDPRNLVRAKAEIRQIISAVSQDAREVGIRVG